MATITTATNLNEASQLFIPDANKIHQILNGDADTTVSVENGYIPTIRKVYADNLYFYSEVLAWTEGNNAVTSQQLYNFGGLLYWAPSATSSNVVPLGTTPVGDTSWQVAPTRWNYLQAVAIVYNTTSDNVALLQTGDIDTTNGVNYFYDADNEVVYRYVGDAITGTISTVGDEADGVVVITMSDDTTYNIVTDAVVSELKSVAIANATTVDNVAFYQTGVSLTASILRDITNELTLIAWDTIPANYKIVSYVANNYAGYDFVLTDNDNNDEQGTFEFVTSNINKRRVEGDLTAFGFVDDYFESDGETVNTSATDNSPAINKAYSAGITPINYPQGANALVSLTDGESYAVRAKSNTIINGNGTTLYLKNTNATTYQIHDFAPLCNNIEVNDLNVVGDVDENTQTTGEYGHGFNVLTAENLTLNRCDAKKCWGDSFYIGLTTSDLTVTNKNIVLNQCTHSLSRRQGVSIIGGQVTVNCANPENIDGTDPQAGIDIEPNAATPADLDVNINNLRCSGNSGPSLLITLSAAFDSPLLPNKEKVDINIIVNGHTSLDSASIVQNYDGEVRIVSGPGTYSESFTNEVSGRVIINDYAVIRPQSGGIKIDDHYSECVPIYLNNGYVEDIYAGLSSGTTLPTSSVIQIGFRSGAEPTESSYEFGQVFINGLYYKDTRGDTFSSTATDSNHRVRRPIASIDGDIETSGNLHISNFRSNIVLADGPLTEFNVNGVNWGRLQETFKRTITGNWVSQATTFPRYGLGVEIQCEPSAAAQEIRLPLSTDAGRTYRRYIKNTTDSYNLIFSVGSGDSLIVGGEVDTDGLYSRTVTQGEYVFYSPADGYWQLLNQ